jgi:pimeloyl-ACP methyl ester carboxylesterase
MVGLLMTARVDIAAKFTVSGHDLYLRCAGGPGPTVVFEAAVGEDHTNWLPIAERLRDRAVACVYDRTGVGQSTKPRPAVSAADHARELHELLAAVDIPRPVVLVGHSYGGLVALLAAATQPADVAGLILVDASHPEQEGRMRALLTEAQIESMDKGLAEMGEVANLRTSFKQVAAIYGQLPTIPLTVISSTHHEHFDDDPADWPYDAVQRGWADLQAEHARLRPDARHVSTDAGHYIHLDDPDLVVAEITRMISTLRAAR